MKNYNGIFLHKKQYQFMKNFEKTIGKIQHGEYIRPIQNVSQCGYQAENGQIEILAVNDMKLDLFLNEIFQLSELQVLQLWNNQIKSLPERIHELTNLETLILGNNLIETLPDSIGDLQFLEYLILKENKLKSIPETIGNLKQLKRLCLAENIYLTKLPESLWELKNLEWLDIHNTNILDIPDIIENLVNLKHLNIANLNKKFRSLPLNLKFLRNLEYLSFSWTEYDNPIEYSKDELDMIMELENRGVKIWRD